MKMKQAVHSSALSKFLVIVYNFKIARKIGKYLLIRFPSLKRAVFDIIMFGELSSSQTFKSLSLKLPTRRPRMIYVDVTGLCLSTLNTGIQRVTREIEKNLRVVISKNFLVIPVYATKRRFRFKHALEFEIASGNQTTHNLSGDYISPEQGDIFIGLDLQVGNVLAIQNIFGCY